MRLIYLSAKVGATPGSTKDVRLCHRLVLFDLDSNLIYCEDVPCVLTVGVLNLYPQFATEPVRFPLLSLDSTSDFTFLQQERLDFDSASIFGFS